MRSDGALGLDSSRLPGPGGEKPHHQKGNPSLLGVGKSWQVFREHAAARTCGVPASWTQSFSPLEPKPGVTRAAGQVSWLGASPRALGGLTPRGAQARSAESLCGVSTGYTVGRPTRGGRGCSVWSVAAVAYLEGPTALGGSQYQSGGAGGCWAGLGRPLRGWAEMLTVSHVLGPCRAPGSSLRRLTYVCVDRAPDNG